MTDKLDDMVSRFLRWPLPSSVCADPCATIYNYNGTRTGTNLLSETEARAMLEYVLAEREHGSAAYWKDREASLDKDAAEYAAKTERKP